MRISDWSAYLGSSYLRVSHENLRLRDPAWLEGVERRFSRRAGGAPSSRTVQPMFAPYRLRDLALANRIVVSPMATYSAIDGTPNEIGRASCRERVCPYV